MRHWTDLEGKQIKTWVFFFAFKSPERGPWRWRAWRWDGCILLLLVCDTPFSHPSRFPYASFLCELSIDLEQQCPVILAQSFLEDSFSTDWSKEWFGDDSSALHLLRTSLLLLLDWLCLKSSGFRSWRLGTPDL